MNIQEKSFYLLKHGSRNVKDPLRIYFKSKLSFMDKKKERSFLEGCDDEIN